MNKITRKLRSRSGASMLIAMVFMLFCLFVGGSVLVSATGNAYRVKHLSDQQDFLNERSASLLMSEMLRVEDNKRLQMDVIDATNQLWEVKPINGGGWEKISQIGTERIITFRIPANLDLNPMQRIMFETTVWRYLAQNDALENVTVKLVNFPDDMTSISEFWIASADVVSKYSIQIEGPKNDITYTANFSSGTGDQLYDFFVDFGTYSQVMIAVNASHGVPAPLSYQADPQGDESTGYTQIFTDAKQITISWSDPRVQKGGAQS